MSDGRFYRAILSADFVGRQKISRFLYDTRAITFLSAIISAVELGSNFGDKIARFYRPIKSRNRIVRLTSSLVMW